MSIYKIIDGVYKGPEHIEGVLDLRGDQVTSLGNLKYVGGYLDLRRTPIKDLGNLESVGEWLDLKGSQVTSLGNLESVGGRLYIQGTDVRDFEEYKEEADTFLKEIRYEDYPLHMNHENLMIRTKINNYLETGVAS
jgi:hypothetical protein